MKLTVAWIGKTKDPNVQKLADKYLERLAYYAHTEGIALKDETKLLNLCSHEGRTATPRLIVLDSRGRQLSSEELAEFLRKQQDQGTTSLLFAVGGPDGFSEEIQKAAAFKLSLGKMTLSHEIARIVLLEQLYRAFTILRGHPYHVGH
ncbi:MAG: 23S rRNA (pseudouridine(1915)-N(3))-methyltransferase RlmH [Terriglobales bacterium]